MGIRSQKGGNSIAAESGEIYGRASYPMRFFGSVLGCAATTAPRLDYPTEDDRDFVETDERYRHHHHAERIGRC